MIRCFTVASRLLRAGVRLVELLARHLGADEADAAVRPVAERLGRRRAAATEGDLLLPGRRDDVPVVIDERHVRDVGLLDDIRAVPVDLDRYRHERARVAMRDAERGPGRLLPHAAFRIRASGTYEVGLPVAHRPL